MAMRVGCIMKKSSEEVLIIGLFGGAPTTGILLSLKRTIALFLYSPSPARPASHGAIERERYPTPGDKNPEIKVGIVHIDNGSITWADFNEHEDQYFGMPYWKPDGSSLLVLWMNREQNELEIYDVNPASGTKNIFYSEKQKTWIDLDDLDRITFLANGSFIMLSDKTGWKHMYYFSKDGKLINPLTSGKFTVLGITKIDEKNNMVYFQARGLENTARIDLYSVKLSGKNIKRLTSGEYNNRIQMSPSGAYFVTTHGNAYTPSQMTLLDNKGIKIAELGNSKGPEIPQLQYCKNRIDQGKK